jgi:hypothetical protein
VDEEQRSHADGDADVDEEHRERRDADGVQDAGQHGESDEDTETGRQHSSGRGAGPRTADDHCLPRDEQQQPEAGRAVDSDDDGHGARRPDAVGQDPGEEGQHEQAEQGEVGASAGAAGQRRPHRHGAVTSAGSTACAG